MPVTTYLSQNVYEFFSLTKNKTDFNTDFKYVLNNCTLNLNTLSTIFCDCTSENFDIYSQNNDWYMEKIKLVHQVMSESLIKMEKITNVDELLQKCLWTNRVSDLKMCYDYFRCKNDCNWLKCVLILTSIIERCLGNIFKLHNKNVPFLLKDLLDTTYLFQIFDYGLIRLMQILFGTSKCLNIRNICWHGFLSENELTGVHIGVLFVILATMGDVLNNKNINNIPCRPQITNLDEKIIDISNRNTFINIFTHTEELRDIFKNSADFIPPLHIKYWENITSHPVDNCNDNCLILFLPIFEHFLRVIFCKINNCNDRNILASNKEKYITLDDIFCQKFENKDNKIFEILNTGCVVFYEDVFSLLNGLRIRDKLSHGEIYLQSYSCDVTNVLLNLFVYILLKTNNYYNNIINNDLLNILEHNFNNYESVYHPNIILKYKIISVDEAINNLECIPRPGEDEIEKCDINVNNDIFNEIIMKCSNKYNENFKQYVKNVTISTIHRPKEEMKFVKKLTRIVHEIEDISNQICMDNEERYNNFINNTLGLRQIQRYDEILTSIAVVKTSLRCILYIVVLFINEMCLYKKQIFKFLLSILVYLEKINRNSNVKINKWRKVLSLTNEMQNKLYIFYKNYLQNKII